jgi:AraC-like DNA-binding protein
MQDRSVRVQTHDDGVNAWRTARMSPSPVLARLIVGYSDYWERTGSFTTRRELPHAEGVLIVNLGAPITITDGEVLHLQAGEAFAAGVHLRPALSQSQGTQAGMHVFLPLATLRRLLGVPMHHLVNCVMPLDSLLGHDTHDLGAMLCAAKDCATRVALLEAALSHRLAHTAPLGPQQAQALYLLRTRPDRDIAAIARDIGWSRKHLAARVQDAVGVGPRCFRRLLRFQTLTTLISQPPPPSWAALAHDAGYCDQSHLIREFREFSGLTPGEYLARGLPDGGGLVEA